MLQLIDTLTLQGKLSLDLLQLSLGFALREVAKVIVLGSHLHEPLPGRIPVRKRIFIVTSYIVYLHVNIIMAFRWQ